MSQKLSIRGKWLELEIDESIAGKTVEQILKEDLSISGRMIQRLTRQKGLFLNRKTPFLKQKGKVGDQLRVLVGDREEGELTPQEMPLDIIYEDEHTLVVNKQAGLIVHPIKAGQAGTLANGIAHYWLSKGVTGRVRPVHRLDKDTSGLILIAKSSYIHQLLDRQLREQRIERGYVAIVEGRLEQQTGTFRDPIGQDPHHPVKRAVRENGDEAVTHFEVLERFSQASVIQAQLETGRTHQIRVHFEHAGHPVVGDPLYGRRHAGINRQALHAHQLSFDHPLNSERLSFSAEMPEDMKQLAGQLRKE
ncbi:hypothetical protein BEP19_12290 [Ammoniphilus oxalaticus]|uniref:Pseudouridine synthase n=1 Tax=Ammoniphilus oxalaticus TaxID=66863 RepID=A0A419SGU3_9BACL|nr:RluA family pseudouridine synthase [Ammoniphilus oxalaticus]RKD23003.1 hypothetical protein BEP19_12290 [Ammoniphilus oxalaticus]